jgi:hypothetical protein
MVPSVRCQLLRTYLLSHRSALGWVIDQYRVTRDERGNIANDPNRPDDEPYILRLLGQVITLPRSRRPPRRCDRYGVKRSFAPAMSRTTANRRLMTVCGKRRLPK